jgi:hypothetical protein
MTPSGFRGDAALPAGERRSIRQRKRALKKRVFPGAESGMPGLPVCKIFRNVSLVTYIFLFIPFSF